MTYDYLNRLVDETFFSYADPTLDYQMKSITYGYDGNSNMTAVTESKSVGGHVVTEWTALKTTGISEGNSRLRKGG